jgi:glycerol-3-phosphate cytidylyltransferase
MFGRYISLQGNKFVDFILPYSTEEDLYNMLKILPIDIRILDEEYKTKDFTGKDLDIEVYFNKRKHNYSSSGLRKSVHDKELQKTQKI